MQKNNLSQSEKYNWLRLARADHVGAVTHRQLIHRFGNAGAALEALPELARRGGSRRNFKIPEQKIIDDEIARAEKLGISLIALGEIDYPESLMNLHDAPAILTVRGHKSLLHKRAIGIVGSRNASINGRKMAEILARDLGKNDFVVASGLARGIDTSAHTGSLETGTIAVLAGGVDCVYPLENKNLYEKIVELGCIISDQPVGGEPRAQLFPMRNRLISGLSLGVVVVEAALKSGSLITARVALEQGREVFAVPGSPLDPRCGGTNDLLRQGAIVTEKVDDIITHIHSMPKRVHEQGSLFAPPTPLKIDEQELDQARDKILESLSPSPTSVDDLIRDSQFGIHIVLTILLELELAGRLERHSGNRVALIGG